MSMKGFTLIETLIAITILTLAIAGPMVTASRAIVAAQTARDQLTASYLAQEGIEYVRVMRDNEYLAAYQAGGSDVSTTAWNNFLAVSINQCREATCGAYGYTQQDGTATPFTRTIQAIDISSGDERIVSKVSWRFHDIPYSVIVTDNLTPWQ